MWRVVVYMFLPAAFVISMVFLIQGMPMTYQNARPGFDPGTRGDGNGRQRTAEAADNSDGSARGLRTHENDGHQWGRLLRRMNSAHPFENPSAATNFFETFCMMLFPMALVLMYGRMLKRLRHAFVIFSVMLLLFVGTVVWVIYFDTLAPNPGLTPHPQSRTFTIASASAPEESESLPCRRSQGCRSISIWAISRAKNYVSARRPRRPSQPRRLM